MRKVEIEIRLTIRFYNSFFFGGGTGIGEIQSYLLRDINGIPYISGAALKGCIAEYAQALSGSSGSGYTKRLFGTGGVQQGIMFFENAVLVNKEEYLDMQDRLLELRTGVSISRYTRSKKEGQLYTMELGGQGGDMTFQGSIHGFLDTDTYQKDIACLVAAIRMIYALGGRRSSGLGWLRSPIECQVLQGTRSLQEECAEQKTIDAEEINGWIREWIKECNDGKRV